MRCADPLYKIFGWTFDGLQITVQRYHCEELYALGRTEEAAEALLKLLGSFGNEISASEVTSEWVAGEYRRGMVNMFVERVLSDLKKKCVSKVEALGDVALSSGDHDSAIARYTSTLSLDPANPTDVLVKRSKARAVNGLWRDALADANEARALHRIRLFHSSLFNNLCR